jgi:Ca2+-transporting ATPase
MKHKPKPKNEGIFAHGLGVRVVLQGFMFGILSLVAFVIGTGLSLGEIFGGALSESTEAAELALANGRTLAFMVLALSQVVQAYNMRSEKSLFKIGPFSNGKLNLASLASVALVAIVMFTPARIAFGLEMLTWQVYLIGLGLAFAPLLIMELAKLMGLIKHHNHK